MQIDDSHRELLWKLPYSGRENQLKTLATYFQAKKTKGKLEAADAADIHHNTATNIEEAYEDLTEQEKRELDKLLHQKRIKESDQIQTDQKGLPA